jgi:hypothetical protein
VTDPTGNNVITIPDATGTIMLTGSQSSMSQLTVTDTATIGGATTINDTLSVNGTTTINNYLSVTGTVYANALSITDTANNFWRCNAQ